MTDLPLTLDPGSALPVSEQLSTQLVDLIEAGTLAAGARLPAVRALAGDLDLAPGTVAKVYRGLEQEGFLVTAGRLGTVVADLHPGATEQSRRAIRAALQPLLDRGLSPPRCCGWSVPCSTSDLLRRRADLSVRGRGQRPQKTRSTTARARRVTRR